MAALNPKGAMNEITSEQVDDSVRKPSSVIFSGFVSNSYFNFHTLKQNLPESI